MIERLSREYGFSSAREMGIATLKIAAVFPALYALFVFVCEVF